MAGKLAVWVMREGELATHAVQQRESLGAAVGIEGRCCVWWPLPPPPPPPTPSPRLLPRCGIAMM